jgi:hypothetical protein
VKGTVPDGGEAVNRYMEPHSKDLVGWDVDGGRVTAEDLPSAVECGQM